MVAKKFPSHSDLSIRFHRHHRIDWQQDTGRRQHRVWGEGSFVIKTGDLEGEMRKMWSVSRVKRNKNSEQTKSCDRPNVCWQSPSCNRHSKIGGNITGRKERMNISVCLHICEGNKMGKEMIKTMEEENEKVKKYVGMKGKCWLSHLHHQRWWWW